MRRLALLIAAGLSLQAATLQGVVLDENRRPVAGATVRVLAGLQTKTDAKGNYRFLNLPAGTFSLHVEMDGSNAAFGPFPLGAQDVKQVDLTLQPAFYDEPKFAVAGVTAGASQGGHGSDVVLRSTESLTKATASLAPAWPDAAAKPATAETLETLRDAVARDPAKAEFHHRLAGAEELLGHNLEAVHEYERAAELDPSEANLFDWGAELLKHRADAPSIEVFSRGMHLHPGSIRMLLGLGTAYYARGDYYHAADYFFAACDVDPKNPGPYLFVGKVQSAAITQSDGFLRRMERFRKLHPEDALANYQYGVSLWAHRNLDALEPLQKALQLDPRLAAAHSLLGVIYAETGDFPRAIAAFERAIAVDPALEEAHYRLGQLYRRAGNAVRAESELATYQTLSKNSAEQVQRERKELREFVLDLRQ